MTGSFIFNSRDGLEAVVSVTRHRGLKIYQAIVERTSKKAGRFADGVPHRAATQAIRWHGQQCSDAAMQHPKHVVTD